jgi:hypothetical protein
MAVGIKKRTKMILNVHIPFINDFPASCDKMKRY